MQKLLSRSHLFIFISIILGDGSERILLNLCQSVLPIFSSRSFIVSSLPYRSLIHSEIIFVYDVKE